MTIPRRARFAALAALALAACGDSAEPDDAAPAANAVEDAAVEPLAAPSPIATPTPLAKVIPAQLHGRWGLTEEDCTLDAAVSTGLLRVTDRKLEFYESVGTLGAVMETAPERMRALFSFTGEGMTWEREMALALEDGGETLVRREFGEDAAPRAFRYTRCA